MSAFSWSAVKAVLIDLSGTLHIDNSVIPGAVEALERLRSTGLAVKFVTNTTKESTRVLHTRLETLGFSVKKDEIFSSLRAARRLADERKLNPLLLVDDAALEDFDGLESNNETHDSVLVGLAPEKYNYTHLNQAFKLLLDGAPLVAIHKSRYYKTADGLALGPGPFVTALEYSSGVTAQVVGKPSKQFFLSSLEHMGAEPHETVMIGDDVRDDVIGAMDAGIGGILVCTGKYRPGDEKCLPADANNCSVVASFTQAVEFLIARQAS